MSVKKTLVSLLFAGLGAVSAVAGPLELNKKLTDKLNDSDYVYDNGGKMSFVRTNIATKAGYDITILARNAEVPSENYFHKNLSFMINDDKTRVDIQDSNADGLGKDDSFTLEHVFGDKSRIYLDVRYMGENNYEICGTLSIPGQNQEQTHIETAELNPVFRAMVNYKIKPVIDLGKKLYDDLVESISTGRQVELPYEDIKQALKDVEPYITERDSKRLESGLLRLGDKYMAVVQDRLLAQVRSK